MKNVEPRTPTSDVPPAEHWPTCEHPALPAQSASECDLVTVPARQGLEAVDILRRGALDVVGPVMTVGPVLLDDACDTLGFLVPPGTADAWDVPGSTCTQSHGRGVVPAPAEGADWLVPPGEADLATDPAVLRAALGEAARLIEAADNCR
ncbi:hypothetical protein [Streptomyces heilongjiangensis]|uniref:Uncharacterized protein n=1 Tax=Streptomyces heilongjiangensis TaxID=945052 RepID=A0ABW1B6S9_9ACTN|nr:hypothetical protein [Streptomyces heilongjiangensis]MDC2947056.1 hypothetical protein [Streptomyces heilongjiangensis]